MLANQKDYGNSAGYYEMAINFNPEDPIAYVKYANTYFHIAPAVAIEKLKTIADQKPNSLLSQRELAEKYYENNQWTKAVEQYKKVIENPNHFESDESRYAVLLYLQRLHSVNRMGRKTSCKELPSVLDETYALPQQG